jgi:hypothetical protein
MYFKTTDNCDPIFCGEVVRDADKRREGDNEVYDDKHRNREAYVYFFRNVGVVSPLWNSLFNEYVCL